MYFIFGMKVVLGAAAAFTGASALLYIILRSRRQSRDPSDQNSPKDKQSRSALNSQDSSDTGDPNLTDSKKCEAVKSNVTTENGSQKPERLHTEDMPETREGEVESDSSVNRRPFCDLEVKTGNADTISENNVDMTECDDKACSEGRCELEVKEMTSTEVYSQTYLRDSEVHLSEEYNLSQTRDSLSSREESDAPKSLPEVGSVASVLPEKCQSVSVSESSPFATDKTIEIETNCPNKCDISDNIESIKTVQDQNSICSEASSDAKVSTESVLGVRTVSNEGDATEYVIITTGASETIPSIFNDEPREVEQGGELTQTENQILCNSTERLTEASYVVDEDDSNFQEKQEKETRELEEEQEIEKEGQIEQKHEQKKRKRDAIEQEEREQKQEQGKRKREVMEQEDEEGQKQEQGKWKREVMEQEQEQEQGKRKREVMEQGDEEEQKPVTVDDKFEAVSIQEQNTSLNCEPSHQDGEQEEKQVDLRRQEHEIIEQIQVNQLETNSNEPEVRSGEEKATMHIPVVVSENEVCQESEKVCQESEKVCQESVKDACQESVKEVCQKSENEVCQESVNVVCQEPVNVVCQESVNVCQESVKDACQESVKDACQESVKEVCQESEKVVCQESENECQESENEMCQESEKVVCQESENKVCQESENEVCQESVKEVCQESVNVVCQESENKVCQKSEKVCQELEKEKKMCQESVKEICQKSVKEVCQESVKVVCQKSVKEVCQESEIEVSLESVKEMCQESEKEVCQESVKEVCQESEKEVCQESVKEICQESVKEMCQKSEKEVCQESVKVVCLESIPVMSVESPPCEVEQQSLPLGTPAAGSHEAAAPPPLATPDQESHTVPKVGEQEASHCLSDPTVVEQTNIASEEAVTISEQTSEVLSDSVVEEYPNNVIEEAVTITEQTLSEVLSGSVVDNGLALSTVTKEDHSEALLSSAQKEQNRLVSDDVEGQNISSHSLEQAQQTSVEKEEEARLLVTTGPEEKVGSSDNQSALPCCETSCQPSETSELCASSYNSEAIDTVSANTGDEVTSKRVCKERERTDGKELKESGKENKITSEMSEKKHTTAEGSKCHQGDGKEGATKQHEQARKIEEEISVKEQDKQIITRNHERVEQQEKPTAKSKPKEGTRVTSKGEEKVERVEEKKMTGRKQKKHKSKAEKPVEEKLVTSRKQKEVESRNGEEEDKQGATKKQKEVESRKEKEKQVTTKKQKEEKHVTVKKQEKVENREKEKEEKQEITKKQEELERRKEKQVTPKKQEEEDRKEKEEKQVTPKKQVEGERRKEKKQEKWVTPKKKEEGERRKEKQVTPKKQEEGERRKEKDEKQVTPKKQEEGERRKEKQVTPKKQEEGERRKEKQVTPKKQVEEERKEKEEKQVTPKKQEEEERRKEKEEKQVTPKKQEEEERRKEKEEKQVTPKKQEERRQEKEEKQVTPKKQEERRQEKEEKQVTPKKQEEEERRNEKEEKQVTPKKQEERESRTEKKGEKQVTTKKQEEGESRKEVKEERQVTTMKQGEEEGRKEEQQEKESRKEEKEEKNETSKKQEVEERRKEKEEKQVTPKKQEEEKQEEEESRKEEKEDKNETSKKQEEEERRKEKEEKQVTPKKQEEDKRRKEKEEKQVTPKKQEEEEDRKEEKQEEEENKEEEKEDKNVMSKKQEGEENKIDEEKRDTGKEKDEEVVNKDEEEEDGSRSRKEQEIHKRTRGDSASADLELDLGSEQESQNYDASSLKSVDSGQGSSEIEPETLFVPSTYPAPSHNQYIFYDFEIPQTLVGRLIGRRGAFVNKIKATTDATVVVHPHKNRRLKLCSVEGTRQQVAAALRLIREQFPESRYSDVTLEQVSGNNPAPPGPAPAPPLNTQAMQMELTAGVVVEVRVSAVVSAGELWVQQPLHPSFSALHRLHTCMNLNYQDGATTPLLPSPIQDGTVCVGRVGEQWVRCQVLGEEEAGGVLVVLLDTGGTLNLPPTDLRQIRYDYMTLPFQATQCFLQGIQPCQGEVWSEEATEALRELVAETILFAAVVSYTPDSVPLVSLYRRYHDQFVHLNERLVSVGHAQWLSPQPS